MGKAAMCIQMLQILNSGRVYKVSELADLLETNPRNVIEYKKELEEVGYYIISIPGKYGGYQMDQSSVIPSLKLTEEEVSAIAQASNFLKNRNEFPWQRDYETAMGKVFSSMHRHEDVELFDSVNIHVLAMPAQEILQRYRAVRECIQTKHVLNIDYLSNDNLVRNRNVHPYDLFVYNNAWFCIGYCELAQDIRFFKLNRIENYTITAKKFRRLISYQKSDYIDANGFKGGADRTGSTMHDDWTHVKLELSGKPAMYVKEYVYGKNQIITSVDQNTTILECDMQYKDNTLGFVLRFGADCKVLEPIWLREKVRETINAMLQVD